MKKWLDAATLWVNAGQVCTFMQVTAIAGKRQVYEVIIAAMLLGLDMIDMKPQYGQVFLPQATVFAPIPGSLPDQRSQFSIHYAASSR